MLDVQMRMVQHRPADPTPLVAEFDQLAEEYQELASLGPPTYAFYSIADIHVKTAQCLRDGGGALSISGDSDGAAARFRAAADAFYAAARPDDAAKCRDKLRDVQVDSGTGVADEVARLSTWILHNPAPSDARAENLVSLAELESRLGDVHAAREHFEVALQVVQELKWPDPGQATAEASLASLIPGLIEDKPGPAAMDERAEKLGGVLAVVKSRALHRRIYSGMMNIVADSNPDLADQYDAKIREMSRPAAPSRGGLLESSPSQLGQPRKDQPSV
jgi:tetratricopeptide (TPR) repeat protein